MKNFQLYWQVTGIFAYDLLGCFSLKAISLEIISICLPHVDYYLARVTQVVQVALHLVAEALGLKKLITSDRHFSLRLNGLFQPESNFILNVIIGKLYQVGCILYFKAG